MLSRHRLKYTYRVQLGKLMKLSPTLSMSMRFSRTLEQGSRRKIYTGWL